MPLSRDLNDDSFYDPRLDVDDPLAIWGAPQGKRLTQEATEGHRLRSEAERQAAIADKATARAKADKPKEYEQVVIGIDVASRGKDRTCVCVATVDYDGRDRPLIDVQTLRRLKKGLFRDTLSQIKRIVAAVKDSEAGSKRVDLTIGIDAGGLGEGLAQNLAEELPLEDCRSIYTTTGQYGHRLEGSNIFVSKLHLVGLFIGAIESQRMTFPKKLKELDTILEETAAYGETISEATGTSTFQAKGTAHDDAITSMSICCLLGQIARPLRVF
jgi:uncharacterized membrane protein